LYKEKFNIQVSHVPSVYNAFPDHYVSTVYKSKNLYRLYINRDKEVGTQVISPVFPGGNQQVLCIIRLSAYLEARIDSVKLQWEKAQANVNTLHADYANSIGLDEAIVTFGNFNLYTNVGEFQVKDYIPLKNQMKIFAQDRGIDTDFQIFLFMDLDTENPSGGWADYKSGVAKVGWIYDESLSLKDANFTGLAYAAYQHEIGHIWGWEHDWSDPYLSESFIADPALFGWTDLDGDGVVEILDTTPYGK
jgi:hypothetical protein